jgi:hypothetical protein
MYSPWKTNFINRQRILGARCTSHVTVQVDVGASEAIPFVVLLEVHNTITKNLTRTTCLEMRIIIRIIPLQT